MDVETRSTYCAALGDLVTSALQLYPAAVAAGLGYWGEVGASAARYHADVVDGLLAAWARPRDTDRILGDLVDRLRAHLERCGESTERAILEFNQALLAARRRPAAPGVEPVPAAPDVHALRRELEALLAVVRDLRASAAAPAPVTPRVPPSPGH